MGDICIEFPNPDHPENQNFPTVTGGKHLAKLFKSIFGTLNQSKIEIQDFNLLEKAFTATFN